MRRASVALLVIAAAAGCGKRPALPPDTGTFAVKGLEQCEHKPLIVLEETSAWSGSPDNLPLLTIYEDGLVLAVDVAGNRITQITASTLAAPLAVAATLDERLPGLEPRISLNNATDQPATSILYRVGTTWRLISVEGLSEGKPSVPEHTSGPPPRFMEAYRALRTLPLTASKPWTASDYEVTMWDLGPPNRGVVAWPSNVAAPPKDLTPNLRATGNPRTYDAHGADGTALYDFVRSQEQRPVMRLPTGEPYDVWVNRRIPDQSYLERVYHCGWSATEYHVCEG